MNRERLFRKTLRRLAEQSVALVLQPGDVWVMENSVPGGDEETIAALRTCHMRGWIEVIKDAVPRAEIDDSGNLPIEWEGVAPVYRLTDAGWHVLNRTHAWNVAIFVVATATLVASVIAAYLAVAG